jgi:hypothetical protein
MRNQLRYVLLAAVTLLTLSFAGFAQNAGAPANEGTSASAATPDITGLWSRLRSEGASARGYQPLFFEFSKTELPMTPWARAKYETARKTYRESAKNVLDDPLLQCFPPGLPRIYLLPHPMQIVQIPGQVIMLFEYDHFIRRIFTDGRTHDLSQGPLWMGDSIGHWEGDTLVTDAIGFNDKTLLDRVGHPHSDQLHLTERIRKIDPRTMEIDFTLEDAKAYEKSWGAKLVFELRPDWKVMEQVCEDNVNFLNFNNKATQGK